MPTDEPIPFCRVRVRREPDWFDTTLDAWTLHALTEEIRLVLPGGRPVVHRLDRSPVRSWSKLFRLAYANNIDLGDIPASFMEALPKDLGRLSMRLVNLLRMHALRNGGIHDLNGDWIDAPAEWLTSQSSNNVLMPVSGTPRT